MNTAQRVASTAGAWFLMFYLLTLQPFALIMALGYLVLGVMLRDR